MKIELRDFQGEAFVRCREAVRAGHKRILVVSPTGSGKSVIGAAFMESIVAKGGSCNFVVDRLSLVDQTSRLLDRYGIDHGVIQADHDRFFPSRPVQICSIHTLAKREWPASRVDIFDEAHILYKEHKDRMEVGNSITIGLTATPFTRGLGKHFDALVNVATTRGLIDQGWLAPYRIFSCAEPDMSGVKVTSMGEWDEKESSAEAMKVVGDVVDEYVKHGQGRKFICSAVDTAHVMELQRQFIAAGINAATYTYKDKKDDRDDVLSEFRKHDSAIRGLITVTAASRGFDQPDVSCIIMARPLRKSLAEHIQLFGRGLRIAPGKTDCLVLDHSGNAARFFQDTEDFFDNGIEKLDDGKEKKKPPPKDKERDGLKCPKCGHLHKPMPFCPVCGHQYPPKPAVAHVPGTLKELIAGKHKKQLLSDLWPQVCGYAAGECPHDPKKASDMATAIYIDLTKAMPTGRWFNTTEPVPPSDEVKKMILASRIKYRHSRKWRGAP